MATKTVYVVFLLPAVLSFVFGGFVLAQSMQEGEGPDASPAAGPATGPLLSSPPDRGDGRVDILGLRPSYAAGEAVSLEVNIIDESFDCGILHITILNAETAEIAAQGEFFDQCFVEGDFTLPVDGAFSTVIDEPGIYEIRGAITDQSLAETITLSGTFTVR